MSSLTDKLATALRGAVDNYDVTGCEGCGVISAEAHAEMVSALAAYDAQRQEADSRAKRIEQGVPRYIVDGKESPHEESNYMADGQYPPFVVFDVDRQENLSGEYPARAEAQQVADAKNIAQRQQDAEAASQARAQQAAAWSVEPLAHAVRSAINRFERLGFSDPDEPVDGGDCVDLVGEVLPQLRTAIGAYDQHLAQGAAPASSPAETAERQRLTEFLVQDWEVSFETLSGLLRGGHLGYDNMPIAHLRYEAKTYSGYRDEVEAVPQADDEPEGMRP